MSEEYKEYVEVHKKIKEILNACADGEYIFRGEKEWYENISSGLYRYYCEAGDKEKSLIDFNDFSVAWEKDILEKAKNHFQGGTSPIEILTELQHYGGKTTLIDFTYNLHAALFFACDRSSGKDGRVILLNKSKLIELEHPEKGIDYASNEDHILIPSTSKNIRATSQNSVFVHAPKGLIEKQYIGRDKIITIEEKLKLNMLRYLESRFGIHTGTIYNDIHGFIQNSENYSVPAAEFYIGGKCFRDGKYKKAIEHLTEYINTSADDELASAYFIRGLVYEKFGNFAGALADYEEVSKFYAGVNIEEALTEVVEENIVRVREKINRKKNNK